MIKKLTQAVVPVLLAVFVFMMIAPLGVQASQNGASANIGFYVQAQIPENQVDKNLSYFDLRVQPGQTQTLSIEIVNESNEEITVNLDAISASTNQNGVIDYKTPGVRDETLKTPFSKIATLGQNSVKVPAKGSTMATFTVEMPTESYDGVILGGIILTKQSASSQAQPASENGAGSSGATIQNVYSYVVGVKLTETNTEVPPDFELIEVKAATVNYDAVVAHYIRNKEASIVKGMALDVLVTRADNGQKVAEIHKTDVDMAPNSVMQLAVGLIKGEDGQMPELEPGEYTSEVAVEYGGKTWNFSQTFRVGREEADTINENTIPDTAPAANFALPWWLVLIIVILLVLVIFLIILLLIVFKRKKREEEHSTIPHKRD